MVRILGVVVVAAAVGLAVARADRPADDELRKQPITTDRGEVGRLLTAWAKEGTAAGNVGDWYDNRDGEHSPLDLRPYPQLQKVKYSDEDIKHRRHWALQPRVLPHVVFGNSSTSAPPHLTGSNPRTLYCARDGLPLLHRQYRGNNLYIYPEHRDHDPGHNGLGDGYGDLFPTNTPYLLISQGSSGSDQPFMRALPFTLAAFRPEVKQRLIDNGLLMPTVQMILRRCNRGITSSTDYLSGKAHPTVFEGGQVDPVAMVQLAHRLQLDSLPPLVQLKVVEEDEPGAAGADYFDPPWLTEKHADTPSVIARIWRGRQRTRRLVVSAADSIDLNKKPLTFHWVLLRGDAKRVTITPQEKDSRSATITVTYHERRPIAPGAALQSNRIDIGVFADNGAHLSPPAFVTFFSLDSEARTYDDRGRIVEIGHGMGVLEPKLVRAGDVVSEVSKDGLAAQMLKLTVAQQQELGRVAETIAPLATRRQEAWAQRDGDERVRAKADTHLREREAALARLSSTGKAEEVAAAKRQVAAARGEVERALKTRDGSSKQLKEADDALTRVLDERRAALGGGTRPFLLRALETALATPTLWNDHVDALSETSDDAKGKAAAARIAGARRKLVQLGIVADDAARTLTLRPCLSGDAAPADRLTRYERMRLAEFHGVVLSERVLPGVSFTFHPNFVDARLTTAKGWRDVYRHDGDTLVGWTRFTPGGPKDGVAFTAEGWRVVETDAKGRPLEARTVIYRHGAPSSGMRRISTAPLEWADGAERLTFEYDDTGKRAIKGRAKVGDKN